MRLWDPGRVSGVQGRLGLYARLVRVEHTLFSLPFAAIGLLIAGCTAPLVYILAFLSLFGLRSAAMVFNNLADVDIDVANPRTRRRPLVAGLVSVREAFALLFFSVILYYLTAYAINYAALLYATPLLILALAYPYAKRVHPLPHLHLGLVLGMAVFGGWVAGAGGRMDTLTLLFRAPWLVISAVTLWVAGFDTIYAVMDVEFDRAVGVLSLPVWLGVERALHVAVGFEALAAAMWFLGGLVYSGPYAAISGLAAGLLALYASMLPLRSLDEIPRAFNLNLAVGFIALTGYILDVVL